MAPAWALPGLGILLGRVDLFGLLWPFGPALFAAAGAAAPGWWWLGAGLTLGTLSRGAWGPAAAQAAFCLLHVPLRRRWRGQGLRDAAATCLLAALLPYGVLLLVRFPGPWGLLLAAFQALLGGLLAAAFHLALRPLPASWQPLREVVAERGALWSLLAAAAIAGLKGVQAGPIELEAVASGLVVAAAGWLGGAGAGAVAGTVAGAVQALSGGTPVAALGAYALSGTLAGVFSEGRRLGAAVGAALGAAGAWLASVSGQATAAGAVLGSALLLAVPSEGVERLLGAIQRTGAGRRRVVRPEADRRWGDLARLFRELARSCHEAAAAAEGDGDDAGLVGRVVGEACAACQRHRVCWQEGFPVHFRLLAGLLARAAGGERVTAEAVEEVWEKRCLRPREVALAVTFLGEARRREAAWRRRYGDVRAQVGGQFKALAEVVEELAREPRRPAGRARAAPRLAYATEVAKLARPGSLISGDTHLVRELPGPVLLAALSDGMGYGFQAASESLAAVGLAERLLRAGFDRRTVVRMTNSFIGLRAPAEGFATLDLLMVDLVTGEAELIKAGAAPTFLVRRGEARVIRAGSLPLGILPAADVETTRVTLEPGDAVVMITDGVLEGAGDVAAREEWVRGVVAAHAARGERGLARKLLEEVSVNPSGGRADDMSVLSLRFWAAGG